jgi:hypothetical protein
MNSRHVTSVTVRCKAISKQNAAVGDRPACHYCGKNPPMDVVVPVLHFLDAERCFSAENTVSAPCGRKEHKKQMCNLPAGKSKYIRTTAVGKSG